MPKRLLVALSVLFLSNALSAQELTFSEWGPSIVFQNHLLKAAPTAGDAAVEMVARKFVVSPVAAAPETTGDQSEFAAVRELFYDLTELLDEHAAFHRGR